VQIQRELALAYRCLEGDADTVRTDRDLTAVLLCAPAAFDATLGASVLPNHPPLFSLPAFGLSRW
jgi:hypothetical protein